jgi:hypothetical protein
MKLVIFSIIFNGMPFVRRHLPVFEQLKCDWQWIVVEGAAANTHDTKWCKPQPPGFSRDGTSEYLNSIIRHPRVSVLRRQMWDGKVSMCNWAIQDIAEPCCLLQVDCDEIWTAEQIEKIVEAFGKCPHIYRMYFWCRYFLGPDIIATSENGYGNRKGVEWLRAFRFMPGMTFSKHEPPVLSGNSRGVSLSRDETRAMGLVFEHYAWQLESQAAFKEKFYGYRNAAACWRRLQENKNWPVKDLRSFLPWVGPGASADRFKSCEELGMVRI